MRRTTAVALWLGIAPGRLLFAAADPPPVPPAYDTPVVGEMRLDAPPAPGGTAASTTVGRLRLGAAKGPGTLVELIHPPHDEWTLSSLSAEGKKSVVLKLPAENKLVLMPRTFLAGFAVRDAGDLQAVLWEYAVNEGGMRFDFNRTYLAVCGLDKGVPAGDCRTEEVSHSDVARYRRTKPEDRWLYWALDSTEKATKSDVRLLLRDHDHDGYRDLVLWRRQCRSISLAEVAARERDPKTFAKKVECDLDFVFEGDEMLWMRFDPATRTFGAPRKDDSLPPPPMEKWRQLPNLGLLFIR